MTLYAITIFLSAFLLFLIQPIIAKQILPWFGGSAAVWTTCLVFFQSALLAGYFYSDWTTRHLNRKRQTLLHIALVVLACVLLPIIPDAAWKPQGDELPSFRILLLLCVTIGLPYFLLATTSPLVQAWFSTHFPTASPYRLFALSNLASMLALIGYPFLVEPNFSTRTQAITWSIGFGLFAIVIALCAWQSVRAAASTNTQASNPHVADNLADAPPLSSKLLWIALSALGSIFLLAVSNHLTQNISSIPLLWLAPLVLYLITFILCFDGEGWYQRSLYLPMLAVAVLAMSWMLADKEMHFLLYWQIGIFCAGLFLTCMFCHGELVARKPAPRYLTTFYLMISIGGAIGAMLVGVVAPLVLPAYFELEAALVLVSGMGAWVLWRQVHWAFVALAGAIATASFASAAYTVHQFRDDVIHMSRNFYGTLRVKEYGPPDATHRKRSLVHGAIMHGEQYLDEPFRRSATTYYKPKSGIGRILMLKEKLAPEKPRNIGVIGLGTGTLAAYGNKGDTIRFYDINPRVVDIAKTHFSYLQDTEARVEVALGDARLNLEREASQQFDVLAIDAFSSDSIPVHLITLEAVQVYEKHMKPDGVIAFHVSNRFLDLKPVVQMLADARGLQAAWIRDTYEDGATTSDWVLLTRDKKLLLKPDIVDGMSVIMPQPGWRLWTDDFNNLLQVLR